MFIMQYLIVVIHSFGLFLFVTFIRFIEIVDITNCFTCKQFDQLAPVYDYIVVGCGSAGSTVALRLAEDKETTVVLLEAGPRGSVLFDIPIIGPLLQLSAVDWQYRTTPQQHAAFGLHKQISNWPMGCLVGGTAALNNMVYIRGHPDDYNEWFKHKLHYNYKTDILSYFKKSENQRGQYSNDTTYHSMGGPLSVEDLPSPSPLAEAVLSGVLELDYPVRDLNAEYATGFMQTQANIHRGSRWTPAHYLGTQNRHNLILQTNTMVQKILFKQNYEAYAVKYSYLGETSTVRARKGIILSAGAIGTPKLLMLSGIGPRPHLTDLGIPTKVNLPVGDNLQDHVATGTDLVLLNVTSDITLSGLLSPSSSLKYLFESSGPWTFTGCEVVGLINTNESPNCIKYNQEKRYKKVVDKSSKICNGRPDLELMVIPAGATVDKGIHLKYAFGLDKQTWSDYFARVLDKNAITILPVVLHPRSKGTVRLANRNIYSKPIIDPNYLSHPYDVDVLVKGIEIVKKIVETSSMQKLGARLNDEVFPGCQKVPFDSRKYWECYVRHVTLTSYHPAGTCKMGPARDAEAVVDYDFHVHKTNKLFVADGSVMPSLPSGNPNAAIVMLAEKAVDELKLINYLNVGKGYQKEGLIGKRECRNMLYN